MKKALLIMALAVGIGASAVCASAHEFKAGNLKARAKAAAATRSGEQDHIVFGYCGPLYDGVGTGNPGDSISAAIEIPAATAKDFKGDKLTGIRIGFGNATDKEVTIFLTKDLTGTPFYKQVATITEVMGWNELTLDEPYEIEGSKFYIGYSFVTKYSTDYPIGIDFQSNYSRQGDYLAIGRKWDHQGPSFGNICLQAVIEGDNLPQYDVAITDFKIPPFVQFGEEFEATGQIVNNGARTVTSLGLGCSYNGVAVEGATITLESASVAPGEWASFTVSGLKGDTEGLDLPVMLTLTDVNGETDEQPGDNKASSIITCLVSGFTRNVVVEEWTGTWCGYCPVGIVGMTYMRENYADKGFIGIAVHGGDINEPMLCSSYSELLNRYGSNYPGCLMDRTLSLYPSKQVLEAYFKQQVEIPTYARVALTADYSLAHPGQIVVDADVEFTLDMEDAPFKLAFVITEDNVGPYKQNNYYAGGKNGPLDGWEKYPASYSMEFNDVARLIQDCFGINESLPANIVKGEKYFYSTMLPSSKVTDINNADVVAMVLNTKSGKIVNATRFKMTDAAKVATVAEADVAVTGAAGQLQVDGEFAAYSVYGVDGKTVAVDVTESSLSLPEGIYIVRVVTVSGATVTHKIAL